MKAGVLKTKESLDDKVIVETVAAMIDGIKSRGKAEFGEKTLLDTVVPVYNFMNETVAQNLKLSDKLEEIIDVAKSK